MQKSLSAIAALLLLAGCSRTTAVKFTITGSDPSFADGKYMHLYIDGEPDLSADSARIENSAFTLRSTRPFPISAYLYMEQEQIGYSFILEDGTIRVVSDGDDFLFTGTPQNDRANKLRLEAANLYRSGRTPCEIAEAMDSLSLAVIRGNRNALGLSLLKEASKGSMSAEEILRLADGFPEEFRQHPTMIEIRERAENMRADIGKPYIDITGESPEGEAASLADIVRNPRNKYVLLEFGASWCGPCREEIPRIVGIYEKYRDRGLGIFGVSFDSGRKTWLQSIDEYGMQWPQVLPEPGQAPRATKVWQDYSLDGIPANFLVDCAAGTIVAKNLRGELLTAKIAELLD